MLYSTPLYSTKTPAHEMMPPTLRVFPPQLNFLETHLKNMPRGYLQTGRVDSEH